MCNDRFNRVLTMGDAVRIVMRCRDFKPSLKVYTIQGFQPNFLGYPPKVLLNNGKHYNNWDLVKEEEVTCS